MIRIKMFGFLKAKMPSFDDEGFWCPEAAGITVGELIGGVGVGKSVNCVILVNKTRKDRDYVLQDGDTMTVMPLSAGG